MGVRRKKCRGWVQCYPEFALHPREMQQTERDEFEHIVSSVKEMYGIDNLVEEALAWYDVQDDNSLGMIELVKQTTLFPAQGYPHHTDCLQHHAQWKGPSAQCAG